MVSREEMDGLRERIEVGVEGTDDEASDGGYCSLNLEAARSGEEVVEVGVLVLEGLDERPGKETETWYSGDAGRLRLESEPVLLYKLDTPEAARGVRSSSASSDISQTLGAPSKEPIEAGRSPEP